MARFFKTFGSGRGAQRQELENKYKSARMNLLIIIAFTAVNMISLATNLNTYFLFSANIPYFLTFIGAFFCGMFPKEYYIEGGLEGMFFFNKSFFVIMLVISILILGLYFLCWLLSKNGKALWLKVALGLFIADTALMLILGSSGSFIIDLAFHIWVIVILISGIKANKELSTMPESNVIEAEYTEIDDTDEGEPAGEGVPEVVMEIEAPTEDGGEIGADSEEQ